MSKSILILVLFPSIALAGVIDSILHIRSPDNASCYEEYYQLIGCVRPHEDLIESVYPTLELSSLYNIGLMNKALQVVNNISECLGRDFECELPKQVIFSLDYAKYIGKRMYGDAFHCFINAQSVETVESCYTSNQPSQELLNLIPRNTTVYENARKPIIECVARKMYDTPSCTIDRILELYEAGIALFDAYYEYLKHGSNVPAEWEFDAAKYCRN